MNQLLQITKSLVQQQKQITKDATLSILSQLGKDPDIAILNDELVGLDEDSFWPTTPEIDLAETVTYRDVRLRLNISFTSILAYWLHYDDGDFNLDAEILDVKTLPVIILSYPYLTFPVTRIGRSWLDNMQPYITIKTKRVEAKTNSSIPELLASLPEKHEEYLTALKKQEVMQKANKKKK